MKGQMEAASGLIRGGCPRIIASRSKNRPIRSGWVDRDEGKGWDFSLFVTFFFLTGSSRSWNFYLSFWCVWWGLGMEMRKCVIISFANMSSSQVDFVWMDRNLCFGFWCVWRGLAMCLKWKVCGYLFPFVNVCPVQRDFVWLEIFYIFLYLPRFLFHVCNEVWKWKVRDYYFSSWDCLQCISSRGTMKFSFLYFRVFEDNVWNGNALYLIRCPDGGLRIE